MLTWTAHSDSPRAESTMNTQPVVVAPLRLQPLHTAPGLARYHVRRACRQSAFPVQLVDDAVLIAGELVSVSIRQTRSSLDFSVLIRDDGIELRTNAKAGPRQAGPGIGTHRGLQLVHRLSQSWGLDESGTSRSMWARLTPTALTFAAT